MLECVIRTVEENKIASIELHKNLKKLIFPCKQVLQSNLSWDEVVRSAMILERHMRLDELLSLERNKIYNLQYNNELNTLLLYMFL